MKKVVLNYLMITVLIVANVFMSCKHDDEAGPVYRINIDEAKTLVLTSTERESKLYGIKSSVAGDLMGEAYEISCLDKKGKKVKHESYYHINVFDAGDHLFIYYSSISPPPTDSYVKYSYEAYFVNKTNGLVEAIPSGYFPSYDFHFRFYIPENKLQFDKYKNFYYVTQGASTGLCQVSSSGSSGIRFSELSTESNRIYGFCVDDEGQIIYKYEWNNDNLKFRKKDGSIVPLEQNFEAVWKGTDGVFYAITYEDKDGARYKSLNKIPDGEIIKIKDIGPLNYLFFFVQRRIIAFTYIGNWEPLYLIDISDETSYQEIPCSVLPYWVINDQLCSYDRNTYSCESINLDTGATSPLFSLNPTALSNYSVDRVISIDETGVTFNGTDLRNNKPVFAIVGNNDIITPHPIIQGRVSQVLPLN